MIIRKIKKNGIVSKSKILKRAILLLVIFVVLKWISLLRNAKWESTRIWVDQINQEVTIKGYLSPDNNFPYYTHSIIDTTKNKVGLKSASINLNSYSGQVEVIGTVEKFLKLTPIVEVTAIKLPSQRVIIKNNTYYFADDFFLLDFSDQPQLSAMGSGKEIVVLFDGKPVVEIERFLCGIILKGKTCTALINDYIANGKDNFTSLRGYTFYKHNDTTWIVFEGDSFGYVFKNIEDDMVLNLSNMITLVNKEFVIKNKSAVIWKTCSAESDPMQKIINTKIKYSFNGIITLNVTGETKEKNTTDCSLAFDPWNNWSVKKISAIK